MKYDSMLAAEPIRYRKAAARDGVGMWRLKRERQAGGPSPFFYMAVVQRLSDGCLVAERGDELIGYVIARPCDSGRGVSVVDLAMDPTHDTLAEANALLARLLRLPAHSGATYVEADPGCDPIVRRTLAALSSVPLAKCKRPEPCTMNGVVDGAAV